MTKKKIIIVTLFVLIAGGLIYYIFNGGQDASDQPTSTVEQVDETKTTADILDSQKSFSMFNEAVTTNQLSSSLDESITVFVPNNSAFDSLPEGGAVKETLNPEIVNYHFAKGVVMMADLTDGQKLMTNSSQELIVMVIDGQTYIVDAKGNKAKILSADLKTSTGVIHEIDRVLLPQ